MESTVGSAYVTDFGNALTDRDFTHEVYLQTLDPVHEIEFTWVIHDFSKSTHNIYSGEFSVLDSCRTKWKCALISSTSRTKTSDLDLELIRVDEHRPAVQLESHLAMTNSEGKVIGDTDSDPIFTRFSDSSIVLSAPHPLKSLKKKQRTDLPGDKLFITGNLKFSHCCITTVQTPEKPSVNFVPRPFGGIEKRVIESFVADPVV